MCVYVRAGLVDEGIRVRRCKCKDREEGVAFASVCI